MIPVDDVRGPANYSPVTFAKDQPQYAPLPAMLGPGGEVITEWMPTAEELEGLMAGGHVRLTMLTFGKPLQPVMLEVIR